MQLLVHAKINLWTHAITLNYCLIFLIIMIMQSVWVTLTALSFIAIQELDSKHRNNWLLLQLHMYLNEGRVWDSFLSFQVLALLLVAIATVDLLQVFAGRELTAVLPAEYLKPSINIATYVSICTCTWCMRPIIYLLDVLWEQSVMHSILGKAMSKCFKIYLKAYFPKYY